MPTLPPSLPVPPQIFAHLDVGKDARVDYVDWISRISVMDTAAIAARCRSRGPFAGAGAAPRAAWRAGSRPRAA